jgi:putative nucleotidyltransferase with HDIG domain
MDRLSADQVIACLKRLPALPAVVSRLLVSFDDEDVDVGHIARQIAQDQSLTARVLRVANSSFYGLQSQIATINEAIVVLGFRAVRNMVLGTSLAGMFKAERCPQFDLSEYVRHSVAVGLAARALARETGQNSQSADLAFTGGILHDIGKLVLAACFAEKYSAVLLSRGSHGSLPVEVERELLGLDHAEIGGLLAEAWHFPQILREVVLAHHLTPTDIGKSVGDLIHVADAMAHGFVSHDDPEPVAPPPDAKVWARLGLDPEKLERVRERVATEMEEVCLAFGV